MRITARPLHPLKRRLSPTQARKRAKRIARRLKRDPQRGFIHTFISKNMMGIRQGRPE